MFDKGTWWPTTDRQQRAKSTEIRGHPNELLTGRSITWWKEGGVDATTNS
jgi:hypothetical protein